MVLSEPVTFNPYSGVILLNRQIYNTLSKYKLGTYFTVFSRIVYTLECRFIFINRPTVVLVTEHVSRSCTWIFDLRASYV